MKWGLIGTRGYAAKAAAPGITASARARLTAVLGRDRDRAHDFAAQHGAEVAAASMEELLATDVEAVWVTSPTWLHHAHGMALLEAGRHVLMEKPMAASSRDAWELVDRARASELVLATGYQARYVPGHAAMARAISEGAIGEVTVARTYYGVHRPGPPPEWRQRRQTARWGALADIGTHHIDLLRMLLGEVTEVTGISAHQLGFETEDAASAGFRFASGALASLVVTVNVWKQSTRVEVHGTKGALVATDTSPAGKGTVTLHDGEHEGGRDLTGQRVPSVWAAQIDAVSAAIAGEDVAYATGADGARNIEVLELVSGDGQPPS